MTIRFHLTRWVIVALVVVVALASVGVTYAGIKGKGPKPPKDKPVPTSGCSDPFTWAVSNDNGVEESGGIYETIDPGDYPSGLDPCQPQTMGVELPAEGRYDKDVAKTEAWLGTEGPDDETPDLQYITVIVENAYPCYHPTVFFALECPDSQQEWITAINTDDVPSALTVTTSGIVEEELPIPIPTGGEVVGALHVHVEQWAEQNATYEFSVLITTSCKERKCGTAYAYGGEEYATCFLDIGNVQGNNWGWTNGPLEPLEPGDYYTFDIYASAGGCDLNSGILVGTLTVDYDGSEVTVTYALNTPYTMDVTHLYVGTEPLPTKNNGQYITSPGQYPYQNDEGTYTITDLSGEIYVVAHAVVCGLE